MHFNKSQTSARQWWHRPLISALKRQRLQTPSAPSVLSLAPSLGTLCSVQWLAMSIRLCICQALAGPLRRQLYQAPFRKHFLASTTVSGFGDCIWDESPGGTVTGWMAFPSVSDLHFVSIFAAMSILFPFLRRAEAPTLWSSFFLNSCSLWIVSWVFVAFGLIPTYK